MYTSQIHVYNWYVMPCIVCKILPPFASAKQNDCQGNKSMNVAEVALEKKGLTFALQLWVG